MVGGQASQSGCPQRTESWTRILDQRAALLASCCTCAEVALMADSPSLSYCSLPLPTAGPTPTPRAAETSQAWTSREPTSPRKSRVRFAAARCICLTLHLVFHLFRPYDMVTFRLCPFPPSTCPLP